MNLVTSCRFRGRSGKLPERLHLELAKGFEPLTL